MSSTPLYQQGFAAPRHKRRHANLVGAPRIPLHQLGWLGVNFNPTTIIGPASGVASSAASGAAVSAVGATGIAAGALTAGIGAGVAVLVGVIAGLWAAHEARVKGATAENQAINSAVQTFDAGIKAIFAAANSNNPAQNITGTQAAQQCQLLLQQFFQQMGPFTHAPGAADASNGGSNCGNGTLNPGGPCTGTEGGHQCNSACTATCCVGCQDLYPTVLQAQQVFANPSGGTVQVCTVYGSKYGAQQRSGYSLTYTPPKLPVTVASAASGVVNTVESALGLTPSTPGAPATTSSWLPWALGAAALFLVLR